MSNAYDPAQPPPDQNQPPPVQNAPPPQLPMNQPAPNDLGLPDLSRQPQQQQQDNSPSGLPPGWGSDFFGNFGPQQQQNPSPPAQGRPPPTWPPTFRENRRQLYVPSMANREPHKLGQPPTFPHKPDMWQVPNIYEGVGRQMSRWGGSRQTRFLAGNLASFTNAYMRAMQTGQRDYARQQHSRMTQVADALLTELGNELTGYGRSYASYSNDPDQLHAQLMDTASQLGDVQMQAALNTSPVMAERLQQWRQAKFDDLHRSNAVRREHDEMTRASNPFYLKPNGPDGLPTERLPAPDIALKPLTMPSGVNLAAVMRPPLGGGQQAPLGAQDPEGDDAPYNIPTGPRDDRGGDPNDAETFERGGQQDPATPQKLPTDQKPLPEPGTDADVDSGPEQQARRDGRVRLAQADTGTMSDAPPPGAQQQDEEDPTDVWDRVRINQIARQQRERRGAGGEQGAQPAGQAGAGQPGAAGAAGQAQRPAGAGAQGRQPAAGGPQANAQGVPAQAGAQGAQGAQAAPGAEGELNLPPVPNTPALNDAKSKGLDARMIDQNAMLRVTGQLTSTEMRKFKSDIFNAIESRAGEVRDQLNNILDRPDLKGDAVYAEIRKTSRFLEQQVRGVVSGTAIPKQGDPNSALLYRLANKVDPGITPLTFPARAKTLLAHTSGKMGENRMKLGTAYAHAKDLLDQLENVSRANLIERDWLAKAPVVGSERAATWLMPETSKKLGALEASVRLSVSEFERVMAYTGGGTLTERQEIKVQIDPAQPERAIADVKKMLQQMEVRNQELKKNFQEGWGASYDSVMKQYNPLSNETADDNDRQNSARGLRALDAQGQRGGGNVIPYDEYFK